MISVIVPAYRAPLLATCVERLLAQRLDEPFEVVACVSADRAAELPNLIERPGLKVLTHVPRLSAAAARNRAAAESQGRLLAFTDATTFASPGWLAALVRGSEGKYCTAGAVVHGTPESGAGTAEYLVYLLDFHPARPPETMWHGGTGNLIVPRELWQELGPFPEDLDGGEDTILTIAARAEGHFRFAADAVVVHNNRTSWGAVFTHQVAAGRYTARLARRSKHPAGALVRYFPLAPVAFLARCASVYTRAFRRDRQLFWRALHLAPGVLALLAGWSAGLMGESARLDLARLRELARASGRSTECPSTREGAGNV